MKKRFLALLLSLVLVCTAAVTVLAAEVPDMSKTGTINVIMHKGETLVPGGYLTIYRVGAIQEDNGNYSFVPTGVFKECVDSFEDVQSPALAKQLADFIVENKMPSITEPVDSNGLATFTDLELGLYLVVQYVAAPGYSRAEPFLIGVPQMQLGMYIYDVDASPKVNLEKLPETTTPTEEPPFASGDKLPQTGQLMWPIPVLVIAGLCFIVLGVVLKKKSSEV